LREIDLFDPEKRGRCRVYDAGKSRAARLNNNAPRVSCPKCGARIKFNAIESAQEALPFWVPVTADCMHEEDIRRALTEAAARDKRIRYSPV
jgi:hypothetical protein